MGCTQKEMTREEMEKQRKELLNRIHYSPKYEDDTFEYRHVILPKAFLKLIPNRYFDKSHEGGCTLRLLSEAEWRSIGITQSLGWEHYEIHTPEPHVLLFRRERDYQIKYPSEVHAAIFLRGNA